MIEYLRYRAKLAQLFRQKKTMRASYAEDIRKARKEGKSGDDIRSIESGSQFEETMINEEVAILATDNLIEKARRRLIPIPSHDTDGMWEKCCVMDDRYVLSNQGISQLRSSLRKEQKERVELVVQFLAPLIGIIGAVTGLVAVIMK